MNEQSQTSFESLGTHLLDSVVALDDETNGSQRRGFFTKRLQAQEKHPEAFISIAANNDGALAGFVCCHLLEGEFGSNELIAVLDAIAVSPARQGHGIGRGLMQQLKEQLHERGAIELRTQAGWDQPGVAGFFSGAGLRLAPRLIVERSTRDVRF
jgi:GNAT superfamily N-acetyltransferase